MGIFYRSAAGPWFFTQGNMARKQSVAPDLGVGAGFQREICMLTKCLKTNRNGEGQFRQQFLLIPKLGFFLTAISTL